MPYAIAKNVFSRNTAVNKSYIGATLQGLTPHVLAFLFLY